MKPVNYNEPYYAPHPQLGVWIIHIKFRTILGPCDSPAIFLSALIDIDPSIIFFIKPYADNVIAVRSLCGRNRDVKQAKENQNGNPAADERLTRDHPHFKSGNNR